MREREKERTILDTDHAVIYHWAQMEKCEAQQVGIRKEKQYNQAQERCFCWLVGWLFDLLFGWLVGYSQGVQSSCSWVSFILIILQILTLALDSQIFRNTLALAQYKTFSPLVLLQLNIGSQTSHLGFAPVNWPILQRLSTFKVANQLSSGCT